MAEDTDSVQTEYDHAVHTHDEPDTYPGISNRLSEALSTDASLDGEYSEAWVLGVRAVNAHDLNIRYSLHANDLAEEGLSIRRVYALRENLNP